MTAWDCQSKRIFDTNGKSPTLQGGVGGGVNNPAIFCMATQQGGAEIRTDDRAPTLTAAAGMSGNNQPVVAIPINDKATTSTLGTGNDQTIFQGAAYGICSYASNSMLSGNPHSGIYEADTSRTLDLNGGNPACNQCGIAVVQQAFDMTHACDVIRECGEIAPSLQARMGTGGNQVTLTYQDVTGTLSPGAHPGSYNGQDAYNDMLVCGATPDVSHALLAKANCAYREDAETYPVQNIVVRRLTPLECERLEGFPGGWTDIGDYTDSAGKKRKTSDSARYKALGNSIALPFWRWMFGRMAAYLPESATLGSLFDGIGGFPLCWEDVHGAGTAIWASEIEEFPIAVTQKRFGGENMIHYTRRWSDEDHP